MKNSHYLPQRVVSLQPSVTVILQELGLLDRLVACTKWCAEVCPEVQSSGRTIVADSWTAQSKQILATQPDLVVASVPYQLDAVAEILKAGIRFMGTAPHCLQDIYSDIAAIARIMGAEERGNSLIHHMQSAIARVREQCNVAAKSARPRVYCEEWGKPLIHSQRWVAELVEAAGGMFVGTPGEKTTAEAIFAADPDFVVMAWCGAGDRVPLEKLVRQRGWEQMRAAREARIYCVPDEYLNTPAPTLLRGLHALAGILHPEIFPPTVRVRGIRSLSRPEAAFSPSTSKSC